MPTVEPRTDQAGLSFYNMMAKESGEKGIDVE